MCSHHAFPLRRNATAQGSGALEVMELLVTISTQQSFLQTMNSSLDFSFLDTNRTDTPITNTTTIIPRQAEPNVNLPAYLDGRVAWGGVPIEVSLIMTVQAC